MSGRRRSGPCSRLRLHRWLRPHLTGVFRNAVPAYIIANMYVGPLWSTAQNLARPNMRAMASAVLLLILNLVGLGAGPSLVGFMNDALTAAHGDLAVRYSLVVVTLVGGLAGIFFWIGSATLREDLASRDA